MTTKSKIKHTIEKPMRKRTRWWSLLLQRDDVITSNDYINTNLLPQNFSVELYNVLTMFKDHNML